MNIPATPLEMLPAWRLGAVAVARHYRLPCAVAAEIVAEQTQAALLRHWQAWTVAAVVAGAWLAVWQLGGSANARLYVLLFGLTIWHLLGRLLARRRIHRAAQAKASRLADPDTRGWPQR